MRRSLHILLYIVFLLLPAGLSAQDASSIRQAYDEAENDYRIGRFDHALELLESHVGGFRGNLLQNAYRLMALCYLAKDDIEKTETYASLLLKENPYYTSVQDPVRFEDMIGKLKTGRSLTVTTASSQAESLNEAPVPVTIITREMIESMGYAKNLNQILAAYVPGMSEIGTYAMDNIAMHGVYTAGQEKILIMENGHRLNARSTNNGRLDYSISTEKIDHIEVLRGPASSLYGNVALTAVVNIITRKGSEINGLRAKYGYGSYGTHKADMLLGGSLLGADVTAWASIYTSNGPEVYMPAGSGYSKTKHDGTVFVGRYDYKPSYDVGVSMQLKDFSFMFSKKYGKQVPQYTVYGEVYDYDRYRKMDNLKPGYSIDDTHLEAGYNKQLGKFNVSASVYGDWYKFHDYSAISDSLIFNIFNVDGSLVRDSAGNPMKRLYHGLYQVAYWEEYTIGAMAKADLNYRMGAMKGNLLVGGQFEHFGLTDTYSLLGDEYDGMVLMLSEKSNYINVGRENGVSFFLQNKHFFTPKLIMNIGFRYDNRYRKNRVHVDAFSPRAALIYVFSDVLSTKLSYSRSFVDAPYFYRQNTSNTYRGSEDLMPEYMNALQLDFLGKIPALHLVYDVNFYYNHLTDIITNNQSKDLNAAKYHNAGNLKMMGVEGELIYDHGPLYSRLTLSYQHVNSAEDYTYSDRHIYSVPSLMGNLNVNARLLKTRHHTLCTSANVKYTSRTLEKVQGSDDIYLGERAIVDLGLRYNFRQFLQMSVECNNLLNTNYSIGGTSYFPYQRLGRTFMGTLSIKL